MKKLKIALVQPDTVWENIEGNLSQLDDMLWDSDADVIVLPEMFTTGFSQRARQMAVSMNSLPVEWMHDLACRLGSLLMGSMIIEEKGKYFNRLLVAFPDGEMKFYDKKHLFSLSDENKIYTAGKERLVFDFEGWKIAGYICYDLRFPAWTRNVEQADLMVFSANWPQKRMSHWEALLKARAIENQCYVAGVNRVGQSPDGVEYNGMSKVYNYWGDELVNAQRNKGVIQVELSKELLTENREHYGFWKDMDKFDLR